MVEPVDPFERGIFDSFEAAPWPTPVDLLTATLRGRILVASTVANVEQTAALRHRAALGLLIDRVAAGRAGDDDAVRLRDLFGPIALLPTSERGECRLVHVGKPQGS